MPLNPSFLRQTQPHFCEFKTMIFNGTPGYAELITQKDIFKKFKNLEAKGKGNRNQCNEDQLH